MRLALIGAGAMGQALLGGWLAAGWSRDGIAVVEPDPVRAEEVRAGSGVRIITAEEAATADVLVLAVKPRQVPEVLHELSSSLSPSTLVISIAAGITLAQLQKWVPEGTAVVRVMPNTPALLGRAMSGVAVGGSATSEQTEMAMMLMGAAGESMLIPEEQFDALTGVSGSGPAYVFYIAEAMIEAGVHEGLTREQSTKLVVQTLLGSAELLATGTPAGELRERVTSPAGTTAAALRVLDERGVRAAFLAAIRAGADRSRAMGG